MRIKIKYIIYKKRKCEKRLQCIIVIGKDKSLLCTCWKSRYCITLAYYFLKEYKKIKSKKKRKLLKKKTNEVMLCMKHLFSERTIFFLKEGDV